LSEQVADILKRITEQRRLRLGQARLSEEPGDPKGSSAPLSSGNNPFLAALMEKRGSAVIAEIKMGSPSLGSLDGTFEPLQLARTYAAGGAAALSVVVEPDFFHGSYELLAACHEACGLPAIAKDFIVDPLQLRWAKRSGASAVLLVAALYSRAELVRYANLARRFGLVPLIEIHDLSDLMKLDGELWELVGVNNRDLRTFEVELGTSLALLHSLPTGALKVAESGIHGRSELDLLRGSGYDAYLIGESLLTAKDPAAKLAQLVG
jgi:indole-3-glycerol phosphate synthase